MAVVIAFALLLWVAWYKEKSGAKQFQEEIGPSPLQQLPVWSRRVMLLEMAFPGWQ